MVRARSTVVLRKAVRPVPALGGRPIRRLAILAMRRRTRRLPRLVRVVLVFHQLGLIRLGCLLVGLGWGRAAVAGSGLGWRKKQQAKQQCEEDAVHGQGRLFLVAGVVIMGAGVLVVPALV